MSISTCECYLYICKHSQRTQSFDFIVSRFFNTKLSVHTINIPRISNGFFLQEVKLNGQLNKTRNTHLKAHCFSVTSMTFCLADMGIGGCGGAMANTPGDHVFQLPSGWRFLSSKFTGVSGVLMPRGKRLDFRTRWGLTLLFVSSIIVFQYSFLLDGPPLVESHGGCPIPSQMRPPTSTRHCLASYVDPA